MPDEDVVGFTNVLVAATVSRWKRSSPHMKGSAATKIHANCMQECVRVEDSARPSVYSDSPPRAGSQADGRAFRKAARAITSS
jgi:hypothetical protein